MPRRRSRKSSVTRGAFAGALAGLAASFAMNQFQAALSAAGAAPDGDGDPSTVKAAERVAGRPLAKSVKPGAGNAVHYSFGTFLGAIYGAGAAFEPLVTAGFGLPYATAVALVADEGLVPAAGLSGPPWQQPASTHAYSLASHLIFGAVLEGARSLLLRVL